MSWTFFDSKGAVKTRLVGAGDAIGSPLEVAGCSFWVDAAKIADLVDGDPVAVWPDLSGNGYDAAQATSDNQPVFKTGILNGLPVVRFDPTSFRQFLALSGSGLGLFQNLTGFTLAFATGANDIASDENYLIVASDSLGPTNLRIQVEIGPTALTLTGWRGDSNSGPFSISNNNVGTDNISFPPLSALFAFDLLRGLAILDGSVPVVTGVDDVGTHGPIDNSPSDAIFIGASTDVVGSPGGYKGDIAEIIVFDRALDTQERRQIQEYLSLKWGLL